MLFANLFQRCFLPSFLKICFLNIAFKLLGVNFCVESDIGVQLFPTVPSPLSQHLYRLIRFSM